MRFPLSFTYAQFMHRRKMQKARRVRYPTVLMLEPLYTCNLACLGCSVERYSGLGVDFHQNDGRNQRRGWTRLPA